MSTYVEYIIFVKAKTKKGKTFALVTRKGEQILKSFTSLGEKNPGGGTNLSERDRDPIES